MKKFISLFFVLCSLTLYLASCGEKAHVHSYDEWKMTKAATCKEAGAEARYCDCGEMQTREISKTAHVYSEREITKEPTCTLDGEEKRTCDCGEKETILITATGHSFGDWTVTKEPTCTLDGEEKRTCDCGEEEIRPILAEHNYVVNACVDCGAKKPSEGLHYIAVTGGYDVSSIGNCTDTDIVIPSMYQGKPVIGIGKYAFSECTGLTSIVIPNSVATIDKRAFEECTGLTSIVIPNSVTSIGSYAFWKCTGLTSIEIGDGVTTIGEYAFGRCSLESVYINDLKSWLNINFERATANPSYENTTNLYVNDTLLTELVIPEGVTEIKNYAFSGYEKLKSVKITNSVTKIGKYAFYQCGNLETVAISDSVTKICEYAFSSCSTLSTLYLGNGLTEIQNDAFRGCSKLKSVYYSGTKTEWGKIFIDSSVWATNVTVYFEAKQPK